MRKLLLMFCIILFCLSACKSENTDISKAQSLAPIENHSEIQYKIEKVISTTSDERITIEYPQLISPTEDYETLNSLIQNDVNAWVNETCAVDAIVNLSYSVTFHDNSYISVLFEGRVNAPNAAHPINVVHSVCVSISDNAIVDLLDSIEIDDAFVEQFKFNIDKSKDINHFSDEQWDDILSYLNTFSDAEIEQVIANGEIALVEDGVLVCISVPHPIGDYLKISVKTYYDTDDFSGIEIGKSTIDDVCKVAPTNILIATETYFGACEYPMKDGGHIFIGFESKNDTLIVADIRIYPPN